MQSQRFSKGRESFELFFYFCIIMRDNISNTAFDAYKISNPIVNSIIFYRAE